jgi:SAM-dependent methyltransferase
MGQGSNTSGAVDFYDEHYRAFGNEVVEWLRIGAIEKVRSLQIVLGDRRVDDVLEIGCGTGAVLERAHQLGIGTSYSAFDVSPQAIAFVKTLEIPFVRLEAGDGVQLLRTLDHKYDLVILSHVLEHVAEPEELLRTALGAAKYVFVEVPLESSLGLNLKWRVLERFGRSRIDNMSGHIRFYSKRSFLDSVGRCGAHVLASRSYVPLDDELLVKNKMPRVKRLIHQTAHRVLGTEMYRALWYGHYAVLLESAST